MHIDLWTLALQTINVLILIWLLARFLFRPVKEVILARQKAADQLLADAHAAKDKAEADRAALQKQNVESKAAAEQQRAEMLANVATERQQLLAKASVEAAETIQQAKIASAGTNEKLRTELEKQAVTLAGSMAKTLLSRLPSSWAADGLFEALIENIRNLSEEDRQKLSSGDLQIVTATPIDATARARYTRGLEQALPGVNISDFAIDTALLAGFELRGPHIQVRNSWQSDLDHMLATLAEGNHDKSI